MLTTTLTKEKLTTAELARLEDIDYNSRFGSAYESISHAKNFILVFFLTENKKTVAYFYKTTYDDVNPLSWYKDSSSSGDIQVKYRPLKNHKEQIINNGNYFHKVDKKELQDINLKHGYKNMGHSIEHYLHSYFNIDGTYKPDTEPFYNSDDIVVNGVGYEIKSENGSLTRETTLKTAYERQTGKQLTL